MLKKTEGARREGDAAEPRRQIKYKEPPNNWSGGKTMGSSGEGGKHFAESCSVIEWLALRILGKWGRDVALDAAQDFMKEYTERYRGGDTRLELPSDFCKYVCTALMHIDQHLQDAVKRAPEMVPWDEAEEKLSKVASPHTLLERNEIRSLVARCLAMMPPLRRAVYVLTWQDHNKQADAARALKMSESTLNRHLVAAIDDLRAALRDYKHHRED